MWSQPSFGFGGVVARTCCDRGGGGDVDWAGRSLRVTYSGLLSLVPDMMAILLCEVAGARVS